MRRKWAALAMALAIALFTAQTARAVSFRGEEIGVNPEGLRAEHEGLVFTIVEGLARYATDDASGYGLIALSVPDSAAVTAIRRFDGGWFAAHRGVEFQNERTENWEGDGASRFSCECYMDCVVHLRGEIYMTYDIAYKLEFQYDEFAKPERRWKMIRFQNIPQEPDGVDLEAINAMDPGIRVEPVTGPTFKGFMVIVSDPSRVYAASIPQPFNNDVAGWSLDEFAEKTGAAVVINGGGFADPNGMGKGGKPNSLVITEGEKKQNYIPGRKFGTVIGFDMNDRLVVVEGVQREDVDALPLRDALAFSPALIINGEAVDNSDYRTELSARTAIGQREDGTVLMLIVDGRQPDSFGANMSGLTQIMRNYGAVNAANLDGGTSTALVFYGQKVNDGSGPDRVSRQMPTAFLVRPQE